MESSRDASSHFSPLDLEQQQPADTSWWGRLVSALRSGNKSSRGFTRLDQETEDEGTDTGKEQCMHCSTSYTVLSVHMQHIMVFLGSRYELFEVSHIQMPPQSSRWS